MGVITQAVEQKKQVLDPVRQKIENNKAAIIASLPEGINIKKFERDLHTAVSATPKLKECDPFSVLSALVVSAQLGLTPNNAQLGEAWVIPYGNKAQFQLGYQGLLALTYRNPKVSMCFAKEVHENDDFDIDLGTGYIHHKPNLKGTSGNTIGYYAVLKLSDGTQHVEYMSKEDMELFRQKYVKASDAWKNSYDGMAKKTILKKVLKYSPRSVEFQKALAQDGAIRTENETKQVSKELMDEPMQPYDVEAEVVEEPVKAEQGNEG